MKRLTLTFNGITFEFFTMEGSDRTGITMSNKDIHTDLYIDKELKTTVTLK